MISGGESQLMAAIVLISFSISAPACRATLTYASIFLTINAYYLENVVARMRIADDFLQSKIFIGQGIRSFRFSPFSRMFHLCHPMLKIKASAFTCRSPIQRFEQRTLSLMPTRAVLFCRRVYLRTLPRGRAC